MSAVKNTINLKGSAQLVAEFFAYSINTILYQRGIYDPDSFKPVKKYGLRLMVATDEALTSFVKGVLAQISQWLQQGMIKSMVLVIASVDTGEPLERWVFHVHTDEESVAKPDAAKEVNVEAVQKEIAAIIRQITASVSFLPLLDQPCTFDLLVYTPSDCAVPAAWEESDPKYISKSSEVRLRSFTTRIHKVETAVSYRAPDENSKPDQPA